eukprot:gene13409-15844_t
MVEPAPKRRMMSSVVIGGSQQESTSKVDDRDDMAIKDLSEDEDEEALRRPPPKEEEKDPNTRKRNRRMFGSLLGTLQKFRDEDKKFQQTETASKRAIALRRASDRAQQESVRLRDMERQAMQEKRVEEIRLKGRINGKAEEKHMELAFATWAVHHSRLSNFLFTKAEPPIAFLPVQHTPETEALLQEAKKGFQTWSEAQPALLEEALQEVKAGRERLAAEAEARRANNQQRFQIGDNFEGKLKEDEDMEEAVGQTHEEGEVTDNPDPVVPQRRSVASVVKAAAMVEDELEDDDELVEDNPDALQGLLGES